jgi:anti-sigma-K factor RskA
MATTVGRENPSGVWRQAAFWLAVLLSVALVVVQLVSSNHGGVQDTTRQVMRPLQGIS